MDVTTPRKVGNSALTVTPLGFGGGTIGSPEVTNDEAFATVKAASAFYKVVRFALAVTTPEVTMFDLAMMLLGWLLRRGPPGLL